MAFSQLIGLIISSVILFFSMKEREKPVLKYYSLFVGTKCLYLAALILQSTAVSVESKLFWANAKTSAGLLSPYIWLLVTSLFTLKRLPSKTVMVLMFLVPFTSIAVIYADPYFHIYRESYELVHVYGTYYQLMPKFDIWYYSVALPTMFVPIIISIYLFTHTFFTAGKYGRLPYGLLLGLTVLSVVFAAPVFSLSTVYDTFGMLSPVSLLLNFIVLKRYSFMDMLPMAKQTAFDIIDSAVFTYDLKGRLVDVNKAGERLKTVMPADNAYALCGFFYGRDRAEPEPQRLMTAKAGDRCYSAVFYQVMHSNRVTKGYVALVNDVTENMALAEVEKEKEIVYQKGLIISDIYDSISGSVGIIGMIAEAMLDSGEPDMESVKRIKSIADDTHKEVRFVMNTYDSNIRAASDTPTDNPTVPTQPAHRQHIPNISQECSMPKAIGLLQHILMRQHLHIWWDIPEVQ